jgi:hypothetical protein
MEKIENDVASGGADGVSDDGKGGTQDGTQYSHSQTTPSHE